MNTIAFSTLLTGRGDPNSDVFRIVTVLAGNVERTLKEFEILKNAGDTRAIELYGAFLMRVAMESACSALLARIDSARAMMAQMGQAHADYDLLKRNASSLNWTGDVLPAKASPTAPPKEIGPDLNAQQLDRALLSDHCDRIYWRKAALAFLEWEAQTGPSFHPQIEFIKSKPTREIMKVARGVIASVYSFLSKAVHPEHLGPKLKGLDAPSIIERGSEALEMIGVLSLLSHFVDGSLFRLGEYEAVATLKRALPVS